MRCAGPQARSLLPFALFSVITAAGCGRSQPSDGKLTFEQLSDSTGLTTGRPLLTRLEPSRMGNGALRVSGDVELPNGTRLQLAIKRPGSTVTVAMSQVEVLDRHFESPPLLGEFGVLPPDRYVIDVSARFATDAQSAAVMRATGDGRTLRGPGVTRDRNGIAVFLVSQEIPR